MQRCGLSVVGVLIVLCAATTVVNAQRKRQGECSCLGEVRPSWADRLQHENPIIVRAKVKTKHNGGTWTVAVKKTFRGCLERGDKVVVRPVTGCGPKFKRRLNFLLHLVPAPDDAAEDYIVGEECTANVPWKEVRPVERRYLTNHRIPCGRTPDNPSGSSSSSSSTTSSGPTTTTTLSPVPASNVDLYVYKPTLKNSVRYDRQYFHPSDCAVEEGCVDQPGVRDLLRFGVAIANKGTEAFVVGQPSDPHNKFANYFEWHQCHVHFHFKAFSRYRLLNIDGSERLSGHKQSFCLMDSARIPYKPAQPSMGHSCEYQGISAGFMDVYGANLECQWIDITDLPGGGWHQYLLRVEIDPYGLVAESDETNNNAEVCVSINKDLRAVNLC
eukprot:m.503248 g.503248  ORF g.503248 m.503248 type:complete len:385 (+) comp70449_c0_seq1:251-1405(+)